MFLIIIKIFKFLFLVLLIKTLFRLHFQKLIFHLDRNDSRSVQKNEKESEEFFTCSTQERIQDNRKEMIIFCDPKYPPYSLETIISILKKEFTITVSVHLHSTIEKISPLLVKFCSEFIDNCEKNVDLAIIVIWRNVGVNPRMIITSSHEIVGEINIARFFNRLIERRKPNLLKYESNGVIYANKIDNILDRIHQILYSSNKQSKLNSLHDFNKGRYFLGNEISIADLVFQSFCRQIRD